MKTRVFTTMLVVALFHSPAFAMGPHEGGRGGNPFRRLRKAVRHLCKDVIAKEGKTEGRPDFEALLKRSDLTPNCRKALQTSQSIRQTLRQFFEEMKEKKEKESGA